MKKSVLLLVTMLLGLALFAQAPKGSNAGTKVLVVYFSRSGNTRKIASMIHDRVGGDLVEIQPVAPYPDDYEAVKAQASREQDAGFKPALRTSLKDPGSYSVVYLGYPIWWAKLPPPVTSFLTKYPFAGKTIIPFCTHQGSRFGETLLAVRKLSPQAHLLEGIAVWGGDADGAQPDLTRWLNSLKVNP